MSVIKSHYFFSLFRIGAELTRRIMYDTWPFWKKYSLGFYSVAFIQSDFSKSNLRLSDNLEREELKHYLFIVSTSIMADILSRVRATVYTEGPCLMRLLVLGKIRISQKFALCDFLAISFHYCNLPYANFGLF